MPTPAERFKGWIESLGDYFSVKLKGWMASWAAKGAEELLDHFEPELVEQAKAHILTLRDNPAMPPELRDLLDKALAPTSFAFVPFLIGILIASVMSGVMSGLAPAFKKVTYFADQIAESARIDSYSWITAFRRKYEKFADIEDDLKDQGWSPERIEALKFYTLFYPSPRDLIGFLAHEVYEDDMAARYGLDMDFGEVAKHLDKFKKAGMEEPQVKEFWRDHWEHTSYMQMVELLHRGLLTETGQPPPTTKEGWETRDAEGTEILRDWYKLVETADFWRDKLTAMSWNVPTRVDVRRWWDMRTISEDELRNIYHRQGYHGEDLENYVKWTKIYTDFGMMMTRFKNGWITEDDIRDWLRKLDIPKDRIEQFIEEKTKPEKPTRTAAERDLTRADFIKGIKKGVITVDEGKKLIMDMGYDAEETDFIIAVHVETEGGSPANFAEYKRLSQLWRYSQGLPTEMKPKEIAAAEKRLAEEYPGKRKLTVEELKVKVDTIRRKRRARQISRDEEIAGLLELGLTVELAMAYADNDDLRLQKAIV